MSRIDAGAHLWKIKVGPHLLVTLVLNVCGKASKSASVEVLTFRIRYLFGNLSQTSNSLLKIGKNHRAIFLILRHWTNFQRYLGDHTQSPCGKSQQDILGI